MRERTTWDRKKIAARARVADDPRAMNQDHHSQQPAADAYQTGGPSEFAEDVHPSTGTWKAEDEGGETARNEIGMPEFRPDTFKTANLDPETVLKKSNLAVKVARHMLPKGASDDAVEAQALTLMDLTDAALIQTANRMAGVKAEDDDEDEDEEVESTKKASRRSAKKAEDDEDDDEEDTSKKKAAKKAEDDDEDEEDEEVESSKKASRRSAKKAEDDDEDEDEEVTSKKKAAKKAEDDEDEDEEVESTKKARKRAAKKAEEDEEDEEVESSKKARKRAAKKAEDGDEDEDDEEVMAKKKASCDACMEAAFAAAQAGDREGFDQAMAALPGVHYKTKAEEIEPTAEEIEPTAQFDDEVLLDEMLAGEDGGTEEVMSEDIQLGGPSMDTEVALDEKDEVLNALFNGEEVQQARQALAAEKTRTVGTKPKTGVAKIGTGHAKAASAKKDEVGELSKLWASAPDVSKSF